MIYSKSNYFAMFCDFCYFQLVAESFASILQLHCQVFQHGANSTAQLSKLKTVDDLLGRQRTTSGFRDFDLIKKPGTIDAIISQ